MSPDPPRSRDESCLSFFGSTRQAPFARLREAEPATLAGPDSFVVVGKLGRGSQGRVFQVQHRETKGFFAMKILPKSEARDPSRGQAQLQRTATERNVLTFMEHPYIISLHYAFQTPSHLALVLQYCPQGNLDSLIQRMRRLSPPLAQVYTAEVLLALTYLHDRRIIFRDLKPKNVVIDDLGHAMLTDFGVAKEGVSGLIDAVSFVGSPAFLAPEVLLRRGHGHTVDIYGLGVLLFTMLVGTPPFYHHDRETLFSNIAHARLLVPSNVHRTAKLFITQTMEREPSRRAGAIRTSDLKGHPFFQGTREEPDPVDWEGLFRREVPAPYEKRSPSDLLVDLQPGQERAGFASPGTLRFQTTLTGTEPDLPSGIGQKAPAPAQRCRAVSNLSDWEFAGMANNRPGLHGHGD